MHIHKACNIYIYISICYVQIGKLNQPIWCFKWFHSQITRVPFSHLSDLQQLAHGGCGDRQCGSIRFLGVPSVSVWKNISCGCNSNGPGELGTQLFRFHMWFQHHPSLTPGFWCSQRLVIHHCHSLLSWHSKVMPAWTVRILSCYRHRIEQIVLMEEILQQVLRQ